MSRRIIECDSCGRKKEHQAHGWCKACWGRWERGGRPAAGPPPSRYGRREEYFELTRDQNYTLKNAAARMGISPRTAQRFEARLRSEGVPPLANEHGQLGVLVTRPMAFSPQHEMAVA
jgi:hypothetical protein